MAKKKPSKTIATTDKDVEVQRVEPSRALSPFDEMERLWEETDRLFGGVFPTPFRGGMLSGFPGLSRRALAAEEWLPRMDVIDRDEEVVIKAELPGVEKDDLDLSVSDNTVTLKGETKKEQKEESGKYYRCETCRGSFSRTVSLPYEVDASKAKASFTNGLLELNLPKKAKSKRHSIKIS
jgi:HSP20 family protein